MHTIITLMTKYNAGVTAINNSIEWCAEHTSAGLIAMLVCNYLY